MTLSGFTISDGLDSPHCTKLEPPASPGVRVVTNSPLSPEKNSPNVPILAGLSTTWFHNSDPAQYIGEPKSENGVSLVKGPEGHYCKRIPLDKWNQREMLLDPRLMPNRYKRPIWKRTPLEEEHKCVYRVLLPAYIVKAYETTESKGNPMEVTETQVNCKKCIA